MRRRARSISFLALLVATGMQVAFLWLLTPQEETHVFSSENPPIEVFFLPGAPQQRAAAPRARRSKPGAAGRKHNAPTAPLIVQPITTSPTPRHPGHKAPDWWRALTTEAQGASSGSQGPAKANFGFPKLPEASAPPPTWDGWDYASTHRIQVVPGNGLLFRLNDECIIGLAPLPVFGCALGKPPVKGDLFKGMYDGRPDAPGALP